MSKKNQLHKRFSNECIIQILKNYLVKELDLNFALEYLNVSRSRFYQLLTVYGSNPEKFSATPVLLNKHLKIKVDLETAIITELNKKL